MGSPCLFTRQRALKIGIFTGCANSNHLYTEFSLGNLKDTKFYFEIKASFIKINSIASFYLFLIACLWGFCTFTDSSVVSLKSSPQSKYTKCGTIFQKKIMFYYQNFFQTCSLLDCAQQMPFQKIGCHRACFLTNCRERWTQFSDRS